MLFAILRYFYFSSPEEVEQVIPYKEKGEVVDITPLSSSDCDLSIFLNLVLVRVLQSKCRIH